MAVSQYSILHTTLKPAITLTIQLLTYDLNFKSHAIQGHDLYTYTYQNARSKIG